MATTSPRTYKEPGRPDTLEGLIMANTDLDALHERYLSTLRAFTAAADASREALGPVRPLGAGGVPSISPAWVEAIEVEREAEAAYVEARDAFYATRDGAQH